LFSCARIILLSAVSSRFTIFFLVNLSHISLLNMPLFVVHSFFQELLASLISYQVSCEWCCSEYGSEDICDDDLLFLEQVPISGLWSHFVWSIGVLGKPTQFYVMTDVIHILNNM
jgi:hypothetical protein